MARGGKRENLIEAWIAAETAVPGRTLAEAVRDLAEAVGRTIRQNRVYEWRDGKRTPPPDVLRHMATVAAPSILARHKGNARAIACAFVPPDRVEA